MSRESSVDTTMNATTFAPVQVGKAILDNNILTVNGASFDLRDQDGYASFAVTTSAIICTALATVFPADTGMLVFEHGDTGEFKNSSYEPWQQYNAAVHSIASNPSLAKVITGWCALLDFYHHFLPHTDVEPSAIALARFMASKAFKAAYATPEAVRQWHQYQALRSTEAGMIAHLEGRLEAPINPWEGAHDLALPSVTSLGELSALTIVDATCGDIIVKDGVVWASAGLRHFIDCVDDVSHIDGREGQFITTLKCGGVDRRFRVHATPDSMVLRMQPRLPSFGPGAS